MKFLLILFTITLSCLNPQSCHSATDYVGLIGEYLEIITHGPTLRDSQRFDGSEDELQFELMICKERSWNPESFDEKCIAFTRDRAAHASINPSFHLSWLGSKIPAYATLRIVAVQDALLGGYPYKRIVVMLDDAEVVFGYDPKQGPFGLLFILSIGGVNADELLEQDISAGYTPSVLLKRDTP